MEKRTDPRRLNDLLQELDNISTIVKVMPESSYLEKTDQQLTIILGRFLLLALDAMILALVLLIGMKIVMDAGAHIGEHRKIKAG